MNNCVTEQMGKQARITIITAIIGYKLKQTNK